MTKYGNQRKFSKDSKKSNAKNIISFSFQMVIASTVVLSMSEGVNAADKKAAPAAPAITTAHPVRKVVLQSVGMKAFQLPTGNMMNMSVDIQTMLNTTMAETSIFSPTDPGASDPCNTHLEMRSAVTNFQLDVLDFGISIGYSPSGPISVPTGIEVKAKSDVRIGTISMDFSVWECHGTECSAIAAVTANHVTAGVNANLSIDFNAVKAGASLVFNTQLGNAMRAIMNNAIVQLSKSSKVNELPWQALVRKVNTSAGTLIFDAGEDAHIGINQGFEIYAPVDSTSTGICNVFESVAYVHTVRVGTVASLAAIDQVFSGQEVKAGDVVMIRTMR